MLDTQVLQMADLIVGTSAAPLDKGHLFQAKYVPFKAVLEGDPWKSEESYSLDEVIYR